MTTREPRTLPLSHATVGRRTVLRTGALGSAGLTAAAALTPNSAHAKQSRGGTVRIAMGHGSTSDTLDPRIYDNGWTTLIGTTIDGYLTEIAPDNTLAPGLAESWEASSDAKTWRFTLRKDTEFHNGKRITTDDVIASVALHRGEDSTSAASAIVAGIEDIRADGSETVVFSLATGNADFPFLMADNHLAIRPSKNGVVEVDPMMPVGAGAYVLRRFEPGVVAEVDRDGDHWKHDIECWFDGAEILAIPDPNARQNAITTKIVDIIDRPDPKTAHLLARRPGIAVEQVAGYQHYTFPMRTDTAPFDDPHVRLAMKHAIDREFILKTVLKGFGQVANDHPISPANRYFHADLPQRRHDIDKAKFHIEKSGLAPVRVTLHAADAAYPGALDASVIYKENAAKAGIQIDIVREPNDGYWTNVWNNKPFCACYWGGRPTEDQMFSIAYKTGAAWNDTAWSNEKFDKLLLKARAELNEGKRRRMYHDMQEIVHADGGAVVPYYAAHVWAKHDNVRHAKTLSANWTMDGSRAIERWWFDEDA